MVSPATPWYRLVDDLVLTMEGHPSEPPDVPSFRRAAQLYYPVDGVAPWFEQTGSMIYPLAAHPLGSSGAPWFQVR